MEVIGRLEDLGVHGVDKLRIRLETRDEKGQPSITRDRAGEPVTRIQIPEPPEQPPYKPGPYDAPPAKPPAPKAHPQHGQPAGHPPPIPGRS